MAQHLTKRTGSLEQGRIYTADSDSDAYGSLLAAMDLGAEYLGEHYYEDGVRSIAVRVPVEGAARKNSVDRLGARVRIGEKFYGKALLDYRPDWRPMWWREAIQNSVDAGRKKNGSGITRIDLTVEALPDGSRLVSCVDNGGGMSWDTFENKFLMLGESGKEATPRYDYKTEMERTRASTEETEEGDAGGFGEAKRLLILPWLDVEVHSRDWKTKATPSNEETFYSEKAPFLDGMRLTVRMPADKYCDVEHALRVITRSFLPTVRFTVNGKPYKADLPLGAKEITEFADDCSGKAMLYHSPRTRRVDILGGADESDSIDGHKPRKMGELIVRKRGIWMFSLPIEAKVPGYLVLRLVAPSVDVLTASRMQIGDGELASAVSTYLRGLAKDHHKALKEKKNNVWRPYKGSLGQVRAEVREEHERLGAIMKQQVGAADKIAERESVAAIASLIESTNKVADEAEAKAESAGESRDKPVGAVEGPQVGDDSYGGEDDEDDAGGSEESGPPRHKRDPDLAKVYAEAASKAGTDGIDALVKVIQGLPDTTILSEIDDFYRDKESGKILTGKQYRRRYGLDDDTDPPQRLLWRPAKRFDPAHMTPQLRKLLKYWTECMSVILIALGEKRPFGVGWIFDFRKNSDEDAEGTLAAYCQRDGKHWLLLNPFRGGDIQAEQLYSLRNDQDLKLVHACAMHEATHFHNYVSDHDVDFAIALTKNIAIANLSMSDLRAIRDAAVKRPAGWKPKPKPVPKPKPPKLKDDVEANVTAAGKEFKKTSFSSAYLPKLDQGKSWWDLLTDFEDGGKRVHRIRHGGTELYRSPGFDGYDKEAAAAQFAVTMDKLRRLIAEAYGVAALAPAADEDLESSLNKWVSTVENKLYDSGGHGGEFYGTSGAGKTVEVEFARATDERQNLKNSYDVIVRVDNRYVGTKETPSVPRKEDWQKTAARAIIKAATPMLAERWRQ